jgi:hypothetical protein
MCVKDVYIRIPFKIFNQYEMSTNNYIMESFQVHFNKETLFTYESEE